MTTALKRLASAVQLRPWPPCFQSLNSVPNLRSVPFCSKIPIQACRSLPRPFGNFLGYYIALGRPIQQSVEQLGRIDQSEQATLDQSHATQCMSRCFRGQKAILLEAPSAALVFTMPSPLWRIFRQNRHLLRDRPAPGAAGFKSQQGDARHG